MNKGELFPYFDMAYQGFAAGDTDRNAFALRFAERALAGSSLFFLERTMSLLLHQVVLDNAST